MGFAAPSQAGPNDLLIAVRAKDEAALAGGAGGRRHALAPRRAPNDAAAVQQPPRTTAAAVRRHAAPGWCWCRCRAGTRSPRRWTRSTAGCDVMIFSDNVPVEQEIALKDVAAAPGPAGDGPGLRHRGRRRGRPGLRERRRARARSGMVAASGTGAQQVLCLLDARRGRGERVRSASAGVTCPRRSAAGRPAPPSRRWTPIPRPSSSSSSPNRPPRQVADGPARVRHRPVHPGAVRAASARGSRTSPPPPRPRSPRPESRPRRGRTGRAPRSRRRSPGALRGLYAGGTLCDEAMVIASERLGTIRSNIPLRPEWAPRHATLPATRPHDDRLRRRRAHRGPAAPDDRPDCCGWNGSPPRRPTRRPR